MLNRTTFPRPLLALALLPLVLAGCGSAAGGAQASSASSTPPASLGQVQDITLPDAVRSIPLKASDGSTVTLQQLQGKVVVLSDTMTLCQESCPLDTAALVSLARDEDSAGHTADVSYLSVTVDPARDTPAQLAAYRKLFAPAPTNWQVTTGSTAGIDLLWKTLGVWRQKVASDDADTRNWNGGQKLSYDVNHSDQLFVLDRKGHLRFMLEGVPHVTSGSVPATLRKWMSDEGRTNIASPSPEAWTPEQARQVVDWTLSAS